MIELAAADGHVLSAYRADPPGPARGAVIVVQEIAGVTGHIKALVDDFASEGYIAIAPCLFDREQAGVALGHGLAEIELGLEVKNKVGLDGPMSDIQAAIDSVRDCGKVAVVGYCWGGYLAYAATNRATGIACAVGYYGGGIVDEYREKRKVPTMLHFGEKDTLIPMEDVQQFRAYRPDVSAFTYAAGHGFNCDTSPGYDADAAAAARARTLFWISQFVDGQPPIALKNAGAYAAAKVEKKKVKPPKDDLGPPMD